MPFLRHSHFWVPLYIFLLLFALMNFEKNKWWWICFAAFVPVVTNFISSDILKEHIFRIRPCQDPTLDGICRLVVNYCPRSSSFTSSHATNHFGMAAFFFFTLKNYSRAWRSLFFVWAFIIVYAQVYVGVHYPGDVLAGGIVGFVFGYLCSRLFNKNFGLV